MEKIHYLDNSATTQVLEEAAQAALRLMRQDYGNPSALHAMGKKAREAMEQARGQVAAVLGCSKEQVIFTSCGTESINTALQSAARRGKAFGRHIVSTQIEHKATLETLKALEQEGFQVTLVPPEKDGTVSCGRVLEAVRPDTILLTMMEVNSETGAILPTGEVMGRAKEKAPRCLCHIDGVQAYCKRPISLAGVDFLSVSGHKIGAMKGVGALYCKDPRTLRPLLHGGGQEGNRRSGTEGLPQIVSMGVASALRWEKREENRRHMALLRQSLVEGLSAMPCPVRIHSPQDGAEHILNISPEKGRSEVLLRVLSDEGVYVSGGSACARGRRSHVLEAMKLPAAAIDGALRVSFCPENTQEDVKAFLAGLRKALGFFL